MVFGCLRYPDLRSKYERKTQKSLFGVRNYKHPYRRRLKDIFVDRNESILTFKDKYNSGLRYYKGRLINDKAPTYRTGARNTL
jgi:hypothetical protein